MDLRVKRLLALLLFLLITASMLLAGCGTPQEATPTSVPTPTATISPSPTSAPTPSPTPPTTTTPLPSPLIPQPTEKELVIKSDLIVAGTITDLRYEVVTIDQGGRTGRQAYTVFTLSVDTVIKGDPNPNLKYSYISGKKTK
ncbi:MAG: hypothetical protein HYX79_10075 [Chloroflexi bacterium]|nr:hypothetical protein [Chloroflexota bacterium]